MLKIKDDHAGAHHNLAMAYKEMGKFDEAIDSHNNGIKHEPNNMTHYFYYKCTVFTTRPERGRREGRRRKCKRLTILPITKYSLILNLFLIFSLCLNLSTVLYPHL